MSTIKELNKGYFKDENQEIEKIYFQFNNKNYLLKKETRPISRSENKKGTEINLYELSEKLQIVGYKKDVEGNELFIDKIDTMFYEEKINFERKSKIAFYIENEIIEPYDKVGNFGNLPEELSHYLGEKIAKQSLEESFENKNKELGKESFILLDPEIKSWKYDNVITSYINPEGLLNIEYVLSGELRKADPYHFAELETGYQEMFKGILKLNNEKAIDEIRQIFNKDNNTNLSKKEFSELYLDYETEDFEKIEKASNKYVNSKIDFSFLKEMFLPIKNSKEDEIDKKLMQISFKTFEKMCYKIENSELFKESTHKRKILLAPELDINTTLFDGKYNGNYLRDENKIFSYNDEAKELKINLKNGHDIFYSQENNLEYNDNRYGHLFEFSSFDDSRSEKEKITSNIFAKINYDKTESEMKEAIELANENSLPIVNDLCAGELKEKIEKQIENLTNNINKTNSKENELIPEILENLEPTVSPRLVNMFSNLKEANDDFLWIDLKNPTDCVFFNFDDFNSYLIIESEYNENIEANTLKNITYKSRAFNEDVILFDNGESYSNAYSDKNPMFFYKDIENQGTLNEDLSVNTEYLKEVNNLLGNIENNIDEIEIYNDERLIPGEKITNAIRNYEVIRKDGTREKLGNIIDKNNEILNQKNTEKINESTKEKHKNKNGNVR